MKRSMTGLLQGRKTRWSIAAAILAALLVWAGPATAGQKQAVQIVASYLASDWGQASVTPSGRVHIRDMGATCMMVSDNPLLTGRLIWEGNANGDAALNAVGSGTGVFEVGTWDLSSGMPVFTPSPAGGLWVTQWEMRGQFPVSYAGKVMAHGVAGEVEGMLCALAGHGGGGTDYYSGTLLDPPSATSGSDPVERPFRCTATVTWTVNMADGSASGHHVGVAAHAGVWTSDCLATWDLVNFVIVSGTGVSVAANGDQIFWKMTADQPMVVQFTGGTGRFEKATGAAPTVAFTLVASEVDWDTMTMTMTIDYTLGGTITY